MNKSKLNEIAERVSRELFDGALAEGFFNNFAHRLLAAVVEEMEPVAWRAVGGNQLTNYYQYNEIRNGEPLYLLEDFKK